MTAPKVYRLDRPAPRDHGARTTVLHVPLTYSEASSTSIMGDDAYPVEHTVAEVGETARLALLVGLQVMHSLSGIPWKQVKEDRGVYQDRYASRRSVLLECGHIVTDPTDVCAPLPVQLPCWECFRTPSRPISDEKPTCSATLSIGDDHGDDSATIRCQLAPGHAPPHQEVFSRDNSSAGMGKDTVTITWLHDEREVERRRIIAWYEEWAAGDGAGRSRAEYLFRSLLNPEMVGDLSDEPWVREWLAAGGILDGSSWAEEALALGVSADEARAAARAMLEVPKP